MAINSNDYNDKGIHKDYKGEPLHLDFPSSGKLYCTGKLQEGGAWITNRPNDPNICSNCLIAHNMMSEGKTLEEIYRVLNVNPVDSKETT